jgi:hypothetical protein
MELWVVAVDAREVLVPCFHSVEVGRGDGDGGMHVRAVGCGERQWYWWSCWGLQLLLSLPAWGEALLVSDVGSSNVGVHLWLC